MPIDPSEQDRDPFPPEKRGKLFSIMKGLREGNHAPPFGRCMYWKEDCTAPPIGSHSLSKCWLETIMIKGHIVKISWSMEKDARGRIQPTVCPDLLGWKEASVFQGFCNRHDTELFRNLDGLNVLPTLDDCLRLVYRSVCREAAAKHHIVDEFNKLGMADEERGRKHVMPQVQFGLHLFNYKFEIENSIATGNYTDYDHLVFDMRERPKLLGTVTFMPLVTARGRTIGANPGLMTLTVLPTEATGLAILTWNRVNNPYGTKFAHALRRTPLHLLGMAIMRILVETSDSVCYSPLLWMGIPEDRRQWIVDTHARSIVNEEDVPPVHVLVPDPKTDGPLALPITGFRIL